MIFKSSLEIGHSFLGPSLPTGVAVCPFLFSAHQPPGAASGFVAKLWLGWRPETQSLVTVRVRGDLSRTGRSERGFQGLWSVEIFERMHAEHITWDIWEWPWCSSFHEPPYPAEETLGVQTGGVSLQAWCFGCSLATHQLPLLPLPHPVRLHPSHPRLYLQSAQRLQALSGVPITFEALSSHSVPSSSPHPPVLARLKQAVVGPHACPRALGSQ